MEPHRNPLTLRVSRQAGLRRAHPRLTSPAPLQMPIRASLDLDNAVDYDPYSGLPRMSGDPSSGRRHTSGRGAVMTGIADLRIRVASTGIDT
jgi:hypothetical protein